MLGILIIVNLILTDARVQAAILVKEKKNDSTNTHVILTFILSIMYLLFENFLILVFLCFFSIASLLLALLLCDFPNFTTDLYEILIFSCFLFFVCINSYKHSKVSRELF